MCRGTRVLVDGVSVDSAGRRILTGKDWASTQNIFNVWAWWADGEKRLRVRVDQVTHMHPEQIMRERKEVETAQTYRISDFMHVQSCVVRTKSVLLPAALHAWREKVWRGHRVMRIIRSQSTKTKRTVLFKALYAWRVQVHKQTCSLARTLTRIWLAISVILLQAHMHTRTHSNALSQ